MPTPTSLEQVKLSSSVTIRDFRKLEAEQNRQEIAKFVQERFSERLYRAAFKHAKETWFLHDSNMLFIDRSHHRFPQRLAGSHDKEKQTLSGILCRSSFDGRYASFG
jgi:hypothetical protein